MTTSGTTVANLPLPPYEVATKTVNGFKYQLMGNGLVPEEYDYIQLGYTGSDLTTVTYKIGGSGGTTVATLTMTYSAGILQTVTRS